MITTTTTPSLNQWRVMLNTRRNFLFALAIVVVSVILAAGVLIPQALKLPTAYENWQSEKKKLVQLQGKLVSLENTLQLADQASLEITDTILPSKKPLLELLTSLRRVEALSGVKVVNLALSPGLLASSSGQLAEQTKRRRDQAGYDVLDLELSVHGTFEQVQQFMLMLEKITPFTTIQTFSLAENNKVASESGKTISASITTGTYYFTRTSANTSDSPLSGMTQQERDVLEQLRTFEKSTLTDQTQVQGGGATDLFGVSGWEELLKSQPK